MADDSSGGSLSSSSSSSMLTERLSSLASSVHSLSPRESAAFVHQLVALTLECKELVRRRQEGLPAPRREDILLLGMNALQRRVEERLAPRHALNDIDRRLDQVVSEYTRAKPSLPSPEPQTLRSEVDRLHQTASSIRRAMDRGRDVGPSLAALATEVDYAEAVTEYVVRRHEADYALQDLGLEIERDERVLGVRAFQRALEGYSAEWHAIQLDEEPSCKATQMSDLVRRIEDKLSQLKQFVRSNPVVLDQRPVSKARNAGRARTYVSQRTLDAHTQARDQWDPRVALMNYQPPY